MFFSTVTIKITEEIDYHKYKIKKNIVESYDYRTLNIKPECLQTINKISSKDKCDFSDLLSVMFLNSNLNLTKVNYTRERYSDLKCCYKKKSANEYNNVSKNISAIFDDIVYFPVAKSTTSGKWISYEDSFGAERNYNGSYPHEGCDIMAENNVSGYYPIVVCLTEQLKI